MSKTYIGMYANTETAFVPSKNIKALMASSDIPQDSVFILVAFASMRSVIISIRSSDTSTMIHAYTDVRNWLYRKMNNKMDP